MDHPDQGLALEWIDNNRDRVEEIAMQRTIERSRQPARRMFGGDRAEELKPGDIPLKTMDLMRNKDTLGPLVREWIKAIFKELFHPDLSEVTQLKSLLFLFMDNLPDKSKEKQYNNLHEKVCNEIK